MNIDRKYIKIKNLVQGYIDLGNDGVVGFGGKLDIRPPYQREFIYDDNRQKAVIESVLSGFPLGIMYWVDRGDGRYEVLDGQQRILSICKFYNHEFHIVNNGYTKYFRGLDEEQEQFLNYELDTYVCSGTESEKLEWFERINVVGIKLSDQELRNASYTGAWLSSSKYYFSKNNSPVDKYSSYMSGKKNRQEWLETAIKWASDFEFGKIDINGYMAKHQHDENADVLWTYYFRVMNWVEAIFNTYRNEMSGVEWGLLYNQYREKIKEIDPVKMEEKVKYLMEHQDIGKKKGIYTYVFNNDDRELNLRQFDAKTKRETYEEQEGKCAMCGDRFELSEMHADHIIPFSRGGLTEKDNCQMLCAKDNWTKAAR